MIILFFDLWLTWRLKTPAERLKAIHKGPEEMSPNGVHTGSSAEIATRPISSQKIK